MIKVYEDESLGYEKGYFEKPTNTLTTIIDCELYEMSSNATDTIEYDVVDEEDFM